MMRRAELLLQWRQLCPIVGELAFSGEDVETCGLAGIEFQLHEPQVALVVGDDVLRRADLPAGGRDTVGPSEYRLNVVDVTTASFNSP